MNRCLNDIFGYCSGEPHFTTREETYPVYHLVGTTETMLRTITRCKNDHLTCSQYLTHIRLQELLVTT